MVEKNSILQWEKFDNLAYLVENLILRYIEKDNIKEMILHIFEDFENEVVVLK